MEENSGPSRVSQCRRRCGESVWCGRVCGSPPLRQTDRQTHTHTRTQGESERNERCVFTVNEYLE